jgi:hypothetical protein
MRARDPHDDPPAKPRAGRGRQADPVARARDPETADRGLRARSATQACIAGSPTDTRCRVGGASQTGSGGDGGWGHLPSGVLNRRHPPRFRSKQNILSNVGIGDIDTRPPREPNCLMRHRDPHDIRSGDPNATAASLPHCEIGGGFVRHGKNRPARSAWGRTALSTATSESLVVSRLRTYRRAAANRRCGPTRDSRGVSRQPPTSAVDGIIHRGTLHAIRAASSWVGTRPSGVS